MLFNDLIPEALGLPSIPQTIRSFENNNNTKQFDFVNLATQHQGFYFVRNFFSLIRFVLPIY